MKSAEAEEHAKREEDFRREREREQIRREVEAELFRKQVRAFLHLCQHVVIYGYLFGRFSYCISCHDNMRLYSQDFYVFM